MGLIPGFKYDIFISYSHVDNVPTFGQREGWIKQFYDNLNLILAKRYGRIDVIKIWWDNKKLDGSTLFNDSIKEGIENSAIFICLILPGIHNPIIVKWKWILFVKKREMKSRE